MNDRELRETLTVRIEVLVCALALACCPALANENVTVEDVVALHLGWLQQTDNYTADLLITSGNLYGEKRVLVDNLSGDVVTRMNEDPPPDALSLLDLETSRVGGPAGSTRTVSLDPPSGIVRRAQLTLPQPPAPFGNSFELFRRSDTVTSVMNRLYYMTGGQMEALATGAGYELHLYLDPAFKEEMHVLFNDTFHDEVSAADYQLLSALALRFDPEGRVTEVETNPYSRDSSTTLIQFTHTGANLPQAEFDGLFAAALHDTTVVHEEHTHFGSFAASHVMGVIPATSAWGLLILTLLFLIGGKLIVRRVRPLSARLP